MTTSNAVKAAEATSATAKQKLNSIACIISRPKISYPSGKMTVDEIASSSLANGVTIEGDELDSALQWFPASALQTLNTQRKQAYELFESISVSIGAFNLVPLDKLQDVMNALEEKRLKYLDAVHAIVQDYDNLIEQHCNTDIGKGKKAKPKSQAVKDLIRKAAAMNEADFKSVFGFENFPAMKIDPVFESDEAAIQQKAQASLWEETADSARSHLKATFKAESKPTARSVNGLIKIRDKLIALSFLDDGIDRVIDCCDKVIQAMPKSGTLSDHEILVMTHFLSSVAQVETLKATAKGDDENGIDMTKVFDLLLPEVVEPETVETETSAEAQVFVESDVFAPQSLFDDSDMDDEWSQTPAVVHQPKTQELEWGSL